MIRHTMKKNIDKSMMLKHVPELLHFQSHTISAGGYVDWPVTEKKEKELLQSNDQNLNIYVYR